MRHKYLDQILDHSVILFMIYPLVLKKSDRQHFSAEKLIRKASLNLIMKLPWKLTTDQRDSQKHLDLILDHSIILLMIYSLVIAAIFLDLYVELC